VRRILAVAVVILVSACASSTAAATGPGDVAVQSKDLPNSLTRCDGSGDIDTFLSAIKANDPSTYDQTNTEWQDAKSHGATGADVVFFADSKDHCTALQSAGNGSNLGGATYPLVINFVVKFKDTATAQDGYTNQSIFGFSESTLTSSGGAGVIKGKDTGLTPNSVALTVAIGSQSFYVAVWQNKAFMVILAVLNIGLDDSKKLANTVNGRIR
jgi:hypothetical protein